MTTGRRQCTGCAQREDIENGARFIHVPEFLRLPGVYCRPCLVKRDAALGQHVESVT